MDLGFDFGLEVGLTGGCCDFDFFARFETSAAVVGASGLIFAGPDLEGSS